jgi:hypothetical protein
MATQKELADLRREMDAGFTRLEVRIEKHAADIIKWSFGFWVGSVLVISGTLVAFARFFH